MTEGDKKTSGEATELATAFMTGAVLLAPGGNSKKAETELEEQAQLFAVAMLDDSSAMAKDLEDLADNCGPLGESYLPGVLERAPRPVPTVDDFLFLFFGVRWQSPPPAALEVGLASAPARSATTRRCWSHSHAHPCGTIPTSATGGVSGITTGRVRQSLISIVAPSASGAAGRR